MYSRLQTSERDVVNYPQAVLALRSDKRYKKKMRGKRNKSWAIFFGVLRMRW
jgi:hypothetical protein